MKSTVAARSTRALVEQTSPSGSKGARVVRSTSLSRKVAFLSDPQHYPEATTSVEVVETHFSWLFLTDRYVYKLKKPQRQVGMDYRSVSARLQGCRAEVHLNRRLAPSVYLEVVPLSVSERGTLLMGRGRRTEDWLVKMARLPRRCMLDTALAHRAVTHHQLGLLASMLAAFYAAATPCHFSSSKYLRRMRRQVLRNRDALAQAYPAVNRRAVECVTQRQLEFIEREGRGLGARGSRVVEAHGDLRPEHVCLAHPMCVIDCLEFNRDLRQLDPAEEIAFLALEVERLGHARISEDLLARYLRLSGDNVSSAQMHFYMSRRAMTRGMLAAMHLSDPQTVDRAHWVHRAHSYLEDARRYAEQALEWDREAYSSVNTGQCVSRGASGLPSRMRRSA